TVRGLRAQYPLSVSKLPRATFCYARKIKKLDDIDNLILKIFKARQGRNGYRIIRAKLREKEYYLSGKTVLKRMRQLNIRSCMKAKKLVKTGRIAYVVPNLIARNFKAKM
ncbi:IS3 family transposase, partial [Avibacterium paragallinarum]|uniref:IS3 family transposase n=1 Tax=Avibacterium paragallinarum TaxID=728 RepID=UPI002ED999FC